MPVIVASDCCRFKTGAADTAPRELADQRNLSDSPFCVEGLGV